MGITGGRSTSISVIMDSAVYLTPQYFLSNSIENWNPRTVMNLVNFNYEKWQNDETFFTKLWDHVLQRGWEKDKWGFLSHTYDSTSITYWKDMGGMYNGNYDGESSIWWNNLTTSIDIIKIMWTHFSLMVKVIVPLGCIMAFRWKDLKIGLKIFLKCLFYRVIHHLLLLRTLHLLVNLLLDLLTSLALGVRPQVLGTLYLLVHLLLNLLTSLALGVRTQHSNCPQRS